MKKIFILSSFLVFLSSVSAELDKGTIQYLEGRAFIIRGIQTLPGKIGSILQAGDILTVEEGSMVSIDLKDTGLLKISEKTKFQIPETEADSNRTSKITLFFGGMWTKAKKLLKGESFEIKTPTATAGVRGTEFGTAYDADTNISSVDVGSGEVATLDAFGNENLLTAGFSLVSGSEGSQVAYDPVKVAQRQSNADAMPDNNSSQAKARAQQAEQERRTKIEAAKKAAANQEARAKAEAARQAAMEKAKAQAEAKAKAEAEAKKKADEDKKKLQEAKKKAEMEARKKAEAEAKKRADEARKKIEEAKKKADEDKKKLEEAKKKADAEAKGKAKAEAKARAAAKVKAAAEAAAAQAKAVAEAKAKADAETKAKAAEAAMKAAAEAKAKAETEAKAKAEAETKAAAQAKAAAEAAAAEAAAQAKAAAEAKAAEAAAQAKAAAEAAAAEAAAQAQAAAEAAAAEAAAQAKAAAEAAAAQAAAQAQAAAEAAAAEAAAQAQAAAEAAAAEAAAAQAAAQAQAAAEAAPEQPVDTTADDELRRQAIIDAELRLKAEAEAAAQAAAQAAIIEIDSILSRQNARLSQIDAIKIQISALIVGTEQTQSSRQSEMDILKARAETLKNEITSDLNRLSALNATETQIQSFTELIPTVDEIYAFIIQLNASSNIQVPIEIPLTTLDQVAKKVIPNQTTVLLPVKYGEKTFDISVEKTNLKDHKKVIQIIEAELKRLSLIDQNNMEAEQRLELLKKINQERTREKKESDYLPATATKDGRGFLIPIR